MRQLIKFRSLTWKSGFRGVATVAEANEKCETNRVQGRMSGWQLHSYSENIADLQFAQNLKKPVIQSPSQVLVKVLAASVNPIDVAMMSKYKH